MTQIKTCGLFRSVDIDAANIAQPDYVGFVFVKRRYRYVTLDQAKQLRQRLNPEIPAVGVYVSPQFAEIKPAIDAGIIQMVQLHGPVTAALIHQLQAHHIPVIRALTATSQPATTSANYLLLDSAEPGSGQAYDWQRVPRPQQPFFLAGGITPDNVVQAIESLHPTVIDVSSGIETNHLKDRQKIIDIVRSVHHAK